MPSSLARNGRNKNERRGTSTRKTLFKPIQLALQKPVVEPCERRVHGLVTAVGHFPITTPAQDLPRNPRRTPAPLLVALGRAFGVAAGQGPSCEPEGVGLEQITSRSSNSTTLLVMIRDRPSLIPSGRACLRRIQCSSAAPPTESLGEENTVQWGSERAFSMIWEEATSSIRCLNSFESCC